MGRPTQIVNFYVNKLVKIRSTSVESTKLLYLSRADIANLGGESSNSYVDTILDALSIHARGDFVQPLKPYLRTKTSNYNIADRIIAMPVHIGGNYHISGLKWIGSKHDNPRQRNLERASGLIILNDPDSNYPIAIIEASLISSMRTAAVTVVAARYLAKPNFQRIACLGCGVIAKHQIRSLIEQFPNIKKIYLYDLNNQASEKLFNELKNMFPSIKVTIEKTAQSVVNQAEVIVTCTTADKPYIKFEWLQKGTFVSNVSIMDLHKDVFLKADKVVVDDWEQSNREKKIIHQLVLEGRFSRSKVHGELGEVIIGQKSGRENNKEIIVLNPMGMAIEDIACAKKFYELALKNNVGNYLNLY